MVYDIGCMTSRLYILHHISYILMLHTFYTPMKKPTLTIASLFVLSGLFWACNSQDAVKEAENEVFAIHDEIMPKMDDLMKLKKELTTRISSLDSLKASGSASATLRVDEDKEQATHIKRNLVVADSLMMDWMSQYKGDTLAKLSSTEALNYLAAQKNQILDVKTKYNNSLEQARQFLGKK